MQYAFIQDICTFLWIINYPLQFHEQNRTGKETSEDPGQTSANFSDFSL